MVQDLSKDRHVSLALVICIFGILLLSSYFLLQPFFSAMISGILLSYILYPLFSYLKRYVKKESIAAMLSLAIIFFLVFIPSIFVIEKFAEETMIFYNMAKEAVDEGLPCIDGETFACKIAKLINKFIEDPFISNYLDLFIKQASVGIVQSISNIAIESVNFFFSLLVILFVTYYGLLEGHHWTSSLIAVIPIKAKNKFLSQLHSITYSILYGTFIIAFLEGLLGFIAFFIVGIEPSLFWGTVIGLTAILPFFTSTPIMWPAIIYLTYVGQYVSALILVVFDLVIGWIDYFLRPYLLGVSAKAHPLLILLGFLGGIKVFGFSGIFVGPFILSFLMLILKTYISENYLPH